MDAQYNGTILVIRDFIIWIIFNNTNHLITVKCTFLYLTCSKSQEKLDHFQLEYESIWPHTTGNSTDTQQRNCINSGLQVKM